MSNMSYCRFRNTTMDLGDCLDTVCELTDAINNIEWLETQHGEECKIELREAIADFKENRLSQEEGKAFTRMMWMFLNVMKDFDVIEDFSFETAKNLATMISE